MNGSFEKRVDHVAALAKLIAVVLIGMGCSQKAGTPEATFEAVADALAKGDTPRYESLLSAESRKMEGDLPESMRNLSPLPRQTYKVIEREVVADTATLTMDGPQGLARCRFVKEKGGWKLDFTFTLRTLKRALQSGKADRQTPPPKN